MSKILAHITLAPTRLCRAVGSLVRPYAALSGRPPLQFLGATSAMLLG